MDNFRRGDRALKTLEAYGDAEGFSDIEGMLGADGEPFRNGYPIGDLIADLCHLMTRHNISPVEMIAHAIEHWGSDIVEQAWEHSADWSGCLQDESNVGRARAVLQANGVPPEFEEAIFIKVGFIGPDDPRHPVNKR